MSKIKGFSHLQTLVNLHTTGTGYTFPEIPQVVGVLKLFDAVCVKVTGPWFLIALVAINACSASWWQSSATVL